MITESRAKTPRHAPSETVRVGACPGSGSRGGARRATLDVVSARATFVFFAVAAFASCEAQELELVPEEPSALDETTDAGATGGTGAVATGGKTSSGGRLATGGIAATGGKSGAGGGPQAGGMSAGTGGFRATCQRDRDCGGGYCENSQCMDCRNSPCKEQTACNIFNGRCEPYCTDRKDCENSPSGKECDAGRHLCVECTDNQHCDGFATKHVCARFIGLCAECVEHDDCGPGNQCTDFGDCKCVDDTGCTPDRRCDQRTGECVPRQ